MTVRRTLPNEGSRIQAEGGIVVMDVVVGMTDGSLANVEIQKVPYYFPGERAACYSADLLMRQYVKVKSEKGKDFSYRDVKAVYTVVILERGGRIFQGASGIYCQRFRQRSDSGIEMQLLQEYVFIALDRFRTSRQNEIENELDAWMHLFTANDPDVQKQVAERYPHLKGIYKEIEEFRKDIGGVLTMFSDALRILDRNTEQLMIDDMTAELERKDMELQEQGDKLMEKDVELHEKEKRIKELEEQLDRALQK